MSGNKVLKVHPLTDHVLVGVGGSCRAAIVSKGLGAKTVMVVFSCVSLVWVHTDSTTNTCPSGSPGRGVACCYSCVPLGLVDVHTNRVLAVVVAQVG